MITRLRDRLKATDDGFTLIELLIVIVILGILAAIVVFAVGSATTDSKKSACSADKETLSVALEAYKAKVGTYPTTAQTSAANDLVSAYLKAWPGGPDYTMSAAATTGVITVAGVGAAAAPCS
jgi:type II secretion system protein G